MRSGRNRALKLPLLLSAAYQSLMTIEADKTVFSQTKGNPPVKQYQPEVEFSRNLSRGGSAEGVLA